MNRPEFERQLATLRERITTLPLEQRGEMETLVVETAFRHASISHHSLRATRAAERLELAHERLGDACRRLAGLAERLRDALALPRPRSSAASSN